MFVLGIDPGLSRCGYGVVTRRGGSLAAVAGGVISSPHTMPLPDRLRTLSDELRALVAEFRPDAVARNQCHIIRFHEGPLFKGLSFYLRVSGQLQFQLR